MYDPETGNIEKGPLVISSQPGQPNIEIRGDVQDFSPQDDDYDEDEYEEILEPETQEQLEEVVASRDPDEYTGFAEEANSIYGSLVRRPSSSTKILRDAGILGTLEVDEHTTSSGYIREIELRLREKSQKETKAAKQESISEAAAVSAPGGVARPATADSLTDQLAQFHKGAHGSLSLPENRQKMQEISAKLDKLSPMERVK